MYRAPLVAASPIPASSMKANRKANCRVGQLMLIQWL
jgi:hypothetical protein